MKRTPGLAGDTLVNFCLTRIKEEVQIQAFVVVPEGLYLGFIFHSDLV